MATKEDIMVAAEEKRRIFHAVLEEYGVSDHIYVSDIAKKFPEFSLKKVGNFLRILKKEGVLGAQAQGRKLSWYPRVTKYDVSDFKFVQIPVPEELDEQFKKKAKHKGLAKVRLMLQALQEGFGRV